ncbi:MAG: hypothetical protein IMW89_10065, partial [Ktedonobacteraceae bacterium]|nr:hypothetical protein [Ktedonobacteraceae bacterium]
DKRAHCGGQEPVRICVRVPKAIFSAFYPFYLSTQYPLFTVEYSSGSPLTLVISVSIERVSQVQSQTVRATATVQSSAFVPPLMENVLRRLTTEKNALLHVQVTDTRNRLYYQDDVPLLLHSHRLMQWTAANRLQIGAWVTPADPAVATLITKAAARLPEQPPPVPAAMVGYTGASPQQVVAQVNAIYEALRLDYHIRYVQASVPYDGSGDESAANQEVRLPAEVLQQGSGMCVELTVLLASAVERIGLNAAIVVIPGHVFLGVAVAKDNRHFEYWDAVSINNNVAADSANVQADHIYVQNLQQRTIVDTILLSEARQAHVGPMV